MTGCLSTWDRLVSFTNCLWGGAPCTTGLWSGNLASLWSIASWPGNWGSLFGILIWGLGLLNNLMLLSVSFFFTSWLLAVLALAELWVLYQPMWGLPVCFDLIQACHVQVLLQDPNAFAHHVLGVVQLLLL